MRQRDPRIDPKAGERLRLGKVCVRVLPCEVPGQVFYELNGKPCQIDKLGWADWCVAMDAEVLIP